MLTVPPLRDRRGDIPELVEYFARKFAEKNRRALDRITSECMELLSRYNWPGNVRELENAVERGIILMRGTELTEKSLPLSIQKQPPAFDDPDPAQPLSLFDAEKQLILKTLIDTGGNKSEAARRLGITPKTLNSKLNKYEES
jgi:two-component system response regulator HydG